MSIAFIDPSDDGRYDRLLTVGGDGPDQEVAASVRIVEADASATRIDIFASAGDAYSDDLRLVDGIAYIGYGSHVFVVNRERNRVQPHSLVCYFDELYAAADLEGLDSRFSVLAVSDSEVLAFARSGELLWKQSEVGLDGVVLHEIRDGRLRGDGEWDPPGGWQPFTLCISSGKMLDILPSWTVSQRPVA